MDKKIPTSKIARSAVLGKALLKIGKNKAKDYLTSKENIPKTSNEEIADIIFDALGELKGVSVKIAQQVALGMPFLSLEYLEKINKSFNQVPPLNKALVRKSIKTELNAYPEEVFDSFEGKAFAAASLGQVHKATKNTQTVAVKIQYPGIKKSIESDMSLMHFALKRLAKGNSVTHLIEEIEERLYEEINYEEEAKHTQFFKENLKRNHIVIPEVYCDLSTQKILTTSFLDGLGLETYLSTDPVQPLKDHYAQLIFDTFFYSLYKLKRFHADPNPGNFLFLENGELALIDFGCVKKIKENFLTEYTKLHFALLNNTQEDTLIQLYTNFGMIVEETQKEQQYFYHEVIQPLDSLYIEPLKADNYHFNKENNFSKRCFEKIFEVQQKQFHSVHKFNQEFLFINRTLVGYYALFEKLEATINTSYAKQLMQEHLN
jgi:predicted unusual protein kinase regulating ubiquinone biosynthesis (AarF/ABC1/UbiB family)